jgi:hypothetical protein
MDGIFVHAGTARLPGQASPHGDRAGKHSIGRRATGPKGLSARNDDGGSGVGNAARRLSRIPHGLAAKAAMAGDRSVGRSGVRPSSSPAADRKKPTVTLSLPASKEHPQ